MSYEYGPKYLFHPTRLHAPAPDRLAGFGGCNGCAGLSGGRGSFEPKIPYDFPRYYFDPHMDGFGAEGELTKFLPGGASKVTAAPPPCQSTDVFLNFLAGAIDRRLPMKISVPLLGTVPSVDHIKAGIQPVVNAVLPQVQQALVTGRQGIINFVNGLLPNVAGSIADATGAGKVGAAGMVKEALMSALASQTQSIVDEFLKVCQPAAPTLTTAVATWGIAPWTAWTVPTAVTTADAAGEGPPEPAAVLADAQSVMQMAVAQKNTQAIQLLQSAIMLCQQGVVSQNAQERTALAAQADAFVGQASALLQVTPSTPGTTTTTTTTTTGSAGVAAAAGLGVLALLLLRR